MNGAHSIKLVPHTVLLPLIQWISLNKHLYLNSSTRSKLIFLTHWTFNAAVTTYKLYSLQLMSTLSITITSVFDDTQAFIKIIKYLNKWSETTLRKCYFSWGKPFAINKRIGDIKLMTTKWENTSVWYPGGWGSAGWIRISLDQFGSHGQISLCKRL